jgi:hypothetical protein
LPLLLALALVPAEAVAERAPAHSGAHPGRSRDAAEATASARRIFPGSPSAAPGDLVDRLRERARLPGSKLRSPARLSRARERAFDEALKDPESAATELPKKLQELNEHSDEIRRERRRTVHARWGATAIDARGKSELELHGRRMAQIRRMQFLAVTEREGEKRAQLLERLARLKDLERGRHERAMAVIATGKGAPSGAPSGASNRPFLPSPADLARQSLARRTKAAPASSGQTGTP